MAAEQSNSEKVAWTVKGWCEAVELSPAYAYELMAAKRINSVKIGGKRLIVTSPREFIASLAEAA
jgi:hypothetical protein